MNILIAEDDSAARLTLEVHCETLGHTFMSANNGEEALELFKDNNFDVILSDWMMPEMDGIELCQHVRADPRSKDIFFLFITVLNSEQNVVTSRLNGANDFVNKPISRDVLRFKLELAQIFLAMRNQIRNNTFDDDGNNSDK